uniref:Uncharacterized protein n=1 Tax=Solanum tuberosum TaxID=4113 RepID=M1DPP8_SOLTU
MSPNDFGDLPFVCLIVVLCLPSDPSRSGPLGGIVLLRGTIRRSADCSFHLLFYPSPSGLRIRAELQNRCYTKVPTANSIAVTEMLGDSPMISNYFRVLQTPDFEDILSQTAE